MLRINYNENGKAYSDFGAESYVEAHANFDLEIDDFEINTSTENIIYAVRCAIYKGILDSDNVVVYFDDVEVKFEKSARPQPSSNPYPSTYFDKALVTLIGL